MKTTIDETAKYGDKAASITVTADALEIDLDPATLGELPARAIAKEIGDGIRSCDVQASPATIARRKARGISSTRKWNATGKLAASVAASLEGTGYAITVSGDRLEDPAMFRELVVDVPVIDAPLTAAVDAAIEMALDQAFQVRET